MSVTADEVVCALRALDRLSLIDHTPATPHQAIRVHLIDAGISAAAYRGRLADRATLLTKVRSGVLPASRLRRGAGSGG